MAKRRKTKRATTTSSSAPITPKFQSKAPLIMNYLIGVLPMSDEDSAAALGSFGVETGGFMFREEVGGSGGYGWAMWTGSRRKDLETWCKANGYDPYGTEAEYDKACMAFFIHEVTETWEKRVLTTGGTIGGVFYPPLKDCQTLDAKTESFWRLYERPGTPHADWRREMAHEALAQYRGSTPAPAPPPPTEEHEMPYNRLVISSGHGKYVRGAHGVIDEVDEARLVTEALATELRRRGADVKTFHDDTSTSQNQNLNTIVNYHNAQGRDLDVSVHFNAFEQTSKPMGTEVLYITQGKLAGDVSAAIASCGFTNRGGKKRTDLFFLNNTSAPAIMLEVCFVDSTADAGVYREQFDAIIDAVSEVLGGPSREDETEPPVHVTPPPPQQTPARIDIQVSGDVIITVNGVTI